ncbi:MAG: hypothetical protein ABIG84_06295 [archaeon]
MHDMDIIEKELKKIDEQDKQKQQKTPSIVMEVCPVFGEPDLTYCRMSAGGIIFGLSAEQKYQCKNCGYVGSVSIEIKSADDIRKIKENYRKTRISKDPKPELMTPGSARLWRIIIIIIILFQFWV